MRQDIPDAPLLPMPDLHSSLARLGAGIAHLGRGVAGLAYPTLCLGCEQRLPDPDAALCPSCLRGLPRADVEAARQMLAQAPIAHAVPLWAFDSGGTVRRVQHALKYGGRPSLGRALGRVLARAVAETGAPIDVVVPVPLSKVRVLERGYNQAEALALGVAEGLEVPMDLALVRTRSTRKQATLSADARVANVEGAFALAPGRLIPGAHVLVIDDVLTTGATLAASARPLTEAGLVVSVAALGLAGA